MRVEKMTWGDVTSGDHGKWETDADAYRVYFWTKERDAEPPLAPHWSFEPYRVVETADVIEVLDWAEREAAGRVVTIWVEVISSTSPGLLKIHGRDPTVAA